MIPTTKHAKALERLGACDGAIAWADTQKSAADAWRNCERGDWMLWLLGKLSGTTESASRRKLVKVCCIIARTALKHVPKGEDRPRVAIETAERWVNGKATIEETLAADEAAARAAEAAAGAAARAAWAAAWAAAGAAAGAAARAAGAAARAAEAAAWAAARAADLKDYAEIVRTHYPKAPPLRKAKK